MLLETKRTRGKVEACFKYERLRWYHKLWNNNGHECPLDEDLSGTKYGSLTVEQTGCVFEECYAPCMLKTHFVDCEREMLQYNCCKRLVPSRYATPHTLNSGSQKLLLRISNVSSLIAVLFIYIVEVVSVLCIFAVWR